MQSDVKGQENPGQASGDRLHFPPEPSALKGYHWMPKKKKEKDEDVIIP